MMLPACLELTRVLTPPEPCPSGSWQASCTEQILWIEDHCLHFRGFKANFQMGLSCVLHCCGSAVWKHRRGLPLCPVKALPHSLERLQS